MSWIKLMKMIKKEANGRPFVFGSGNKKAKLMIIQNSPYSKKRMINHVLSQMNVKREEVYITHVFKTKQVMLGQREISRWIPILQKEVFLVKPVQIIALGKAAKIACFEGQLNAFPSKKVVNIKLTFGKRLEKLWIEKLKPIIGF